MESDNPINDENFNVLLYISGLSSKDDLPDEIINNCENWLSDFTQNSNLNAKTNEFGNCELDKVPHSKIINKPIDHISEINEISTVIYNDILTSLEATMVKDNVSINDDVKFSSSKTNSAINENNLTDYKSLNEELPIHAFKHVDIIHSEISRNMPMDYVKLNKILSSKVTDITPLNEEISIESEEQKSASNFDEIHNKVEIASNANNKNAFKNPNTTSKPEIFQQFKCKVCDYITEDIKDFGNHLKNVHNEILYNPTRYPYECHKCNFRCRGKLTLEKHLKKEHPNPPHTGRGRHLRQNFPT